MSKENIKKTCQEKILGYLLDNFKKETMAHAYVFLGPKGSGRMNLLELFAKDIFGKDGINHPSVYTVCPETGKSVISIDQIRKLREWVGHSPIKGSKKISIIKRAELMNIEAQSAFLKILEEPSADSYIFLLAGHKKQLLPTICSRSAQLFFNSSSLESLNLDTEDKKLKEASDDLINKIFEANNPNERMRIWIKADFKKENISFWLENAIIKFRKQMVQEAKEGNLKRALSFSLIIKNIQQSIARPVGQNWQLVAENAIISL